METTERIAEAFVRHVMGCATITNIRCDGQNEIDLLAINPKTMARYHVEVTVSISSSFKKLTDKPFDPDKIKERVHVAGQRRTVGFFVDRKFGKSTVLERLKDYGFAVGNYSKVIVTWDWTEEAARQATEAGIELWDFRRMIADLADNVKKDRSYHTDDTLRTLSLFAKAMKDMEKQAPKPAPKPKPTTGIGNFWVYVNEPNNKAFLHLADCSCCNHGQGIHSNKTDANVIWYGPCDETTARNTARTSGKKNIRWCSHCAGKLEIRPDDV